MRVMRVSYLCDGLDKCSDKVGCFRVAKPGMDYCYHTFCAAHAVNGPCNDPENHPERFHRIDISDKETCWWEGEVFQPNADYSH